MIGAFACDYEFMSNFSLHEVKFSGIVYPTSEHAYQAAKATNDADHTWVLEAPTPGGAKKRGQEITRRADWNDVKDRYMLAILLCKFSQNHALKTLLMDTGDQTLVEGNTWHDNYWGNCLCDKASCKSITGKNTLGSALMAVRKELRGRSS